MKTITVENKCFLLKTEHTSYMLRIDAYGHPEHIHYGGTVDIKDADALALKRTVPYGDSVFYDGEYCLDTIPLEWSGNGRGDYRLSPAELEKESGTASDFVYAGYEICAGSTIENGLPSAYGCNGELILHMKDMTAGLRLDLHYAVFADCDVIARRTVLFNDSGSCVVIHKLMSMSLDLVDRDLVMMTFDGGWAHEMHLSERIIERGTYCSSSNEGFSSSRTNPGFLLRGRSTTEESGRCFGFNLIWSGSHLSSVSRDDHDCVRVMSGVNPERFHYDLEPGTCFCTPEAVLTFSSSGLNDLSSHFHDFVNEHVVRGKWKNRERPVLVNDWEAFMFAFDEEKLLRLAATGKKLGAELFVLDDGWFGKRNDDRAGLGDYNVNKEKLPHGIRGLSDRIHDMGMLFGLWFEPEAVNPDSDLYRRHPDWALDDRPYRTLYGRNELLLDLTKKEVRDYIVRNVSAILDEGNVDYVKWDMNRQLTSGDGAYSYAYICGLYECLERIFGPRDHILLESCSSGGNRFDLGMLCFSPQIWASDDTDAAERLEIQKGYSYLYPQSTIGAHVSAVPNAQTMRIVPLHTRFNTAAFGVLGYELDVSALNEVEQEEIRREIAFYVEHRQLLQFGRMERGITDQKHEQFSIRNDRCVIAAMFRRSVSAAPAPEKLIVKNLPEGRYRIRVRRALMAADDMMEKYAVGAGTAAGKGAIWTEEEVMEASGAALAEGLPLNNVFNGSGYNVHVRFPMDFGSELYIIEYISSDESAG